MQGEDDEEEQLEDEEDTTLEDPGEVDTNNNTGEDDDDSDEDEEEEEEQQQHHGHQSLDLVLKKVRKICSSFRRSPTKNERLQKLVVQEHGHELHLLLDCPTRWSSLHTMVSRFLQVSECIQTCMFKDRETFPLHPEDMDLLQHLSDCLEPIKDTLLLLCQSDTDLMDADYGIQFLLKRLEELATEGEEKEMEVLLAAELKAAVRERILQRRQQKLVSALTYLHDPAVYGKKDKGEFAMDSATAAKKTIQELHGRLFSEQQEELLRQAEAEQEEKEDSQETEQSQPLSFKEQLKKGMQKQKEIALRDLMGQGPLKRAFYAFESCQTRCQPLSNVLLALKTIPPTSCEAERSFSALGNVVTKRRARMGDDLVDSICFLRGHYQNKKKK